MIPLCILDATVRVFVDKDNVLKAIFFQTAEMKKIKVKIWVMDAI